MDESGQLDNHALLAAADQRARLLLARCGGSVQRADTTIAVRLDNGVELAVSYLACLSAGLRYLPLPTTSAAAATRLLQALSPRLLITSSTQDPCAAGMETLLVDDLQPAPGSVSLPAPDPRRDTHVLLTSGTETGTPKVVVTDHVGSMLSHRWRTRQWPYRPGDVIGCNTFGIWDVVPALLQGVPAVMLADATMRDPAALAAALTRYGISRIMMTPTLLDACLSSAETRLALGRLQQITLCGEPVTAPLVERLRQDLPRVHIADLYSLSECHDVAAGLLDPDAGTISRRVADFADVHVTAADDVGELVPVGETGRILVSGAGLARGYLDEQTTAQRFFEAALDGGGAPLRVYDTGDLGRLNGDGTLEVLGRLDVRVKVRGAWADPDAVTAVLLAHPWIDRAVTVPYQDPSGHTRLRAFAVAAAGAPAGLDSALRADLERRLSPQSLPADVDLRRNLPLLPSGKIDVQALLQSRAAAAMPHSSADQSVYEAILAAFREVLGRPDATARDGFTDLGGDSLAAIILCGRIQTVTGRPLRLVELYRHPTPAELARFIGDRHAAAPTGPLLLPREPLPAAAAPRAGTAGTVLLTGATGALGAPLLARLLAEPTIRVIALVRDDNERRAWLRLTSLLPDDASTERLTAVAGDLSQARLGLSVSAFRRLAGEADAVIHLGARLDMFAGYEALAAVNVSGTRTALEIALAGGAAFHHLSSSSVLPLNSVERWDETCRGSALLEGLAERLRHSDGYSQTKLAAELLVWRAAERGLPVTVTRVPHLLGADAGSRLAATFDTLMELGVLPEGPWHWQLAPLKAVCDHLLHRLAESDPAGRLYHLCCPPLTDGELEAACVARGHHPSRLTLPALANLLVAVAGDRTFRADPHRARLASLAQLVREHGVRAGLCLGEATLASDRYLAEDPAGLLLDLLTR